MRSTLISILWVMLFLFFGIYIDKTVENFGSSYEKDIDIAYNYVYQEDWNNSYIKLKDLFKKLETQRDLWLKVLNHQYYDDLSLELSLVKNAIYCKDKISALEGLQRAKYILSNIIEDEKCTLNHIF